MVGAGRARRRPAARAARRAARDRPRPDDRAGHGGGDRRAPRPGSSASPPSASSASSSRSSPRPPCAPASPLMDAHGITAQVLPELRRCAAWSRTSSTTSTSTTTRSRCSTRSWRSSATRSAPGSASTPRRSPRCCASRWPTSSRAGRRCASPRCCTTPPSRGRGGCAPTAASRASPATTARAPSSRATVLRRLRASEKLADHVAALCLHHLRLGFLVHERPLDRRARLALPAGDRAVVAGGHDLHGRRPARDPRPQRRAGDRRPPRARARAARARARPAGGGPAGAARARRRAGARARHPARARGSASCSPSSRRTATRARSPRARGASRARGSCAAAERAHRLEADRRGRGDRAEVEVRRHVARRVVVRGHLVAVDRGEHAGRVAGLERDQRVGGEARSAGRAAAACPARSPQSASQSRTAGV